MRSATHIRLRFIDIARIERRENFIAVFVGKHASAVDIFLPSKSMLKAVQRADILSNIFSPFMFSVVPTASKRVAVPPRRHREFVVAGK